jgi:hypothetical protein
MNNFIFLFISHFEIKKVLISKNQIEILKK